jgi:hypothetical protein
MLRNQSLKQILADTRQYWDHGGTRSAVRENFLKILDCGTLALGFSYTSRVSRLYEISFLNFLYVQKPVFSLPKPVSSCWCGIRSKSEKLPTPTKK